MQLRLSRQRTLLRLTFVRSIGGSFLPGIFGVVSAGVGRLQARERITGAIDTGWSKAWSQDDPLPDYRREHGPAMRASNQILVNSRFKARGSSE